MNIRNTGNRWVAIGAILAALSVVLGAFGAHALYPMISENMADPVKSKHNWETASRYHMYHSIGIMLTGICFAVFEKRKEFKIAAVAFVIGITIFSGMLYTLAITDIKILGAIVPVGGLAMIIGWIFLSVGAWRVNSERIENSKE